MPSLTSLPLFFFLLLGTGFASWAGLLPAQGDDGPIQMTPELALVFPFASTPDGVSVKFPVMINPNTILNPGIILRCIYMPPREDTVADNGFDLDKAQTSNIDRAYARSSAGSSDDDPQPMSRDVLQAISQAKKIVWTSPNNFQLALAQYPLDFSHLIYSRKSTEGREKELKDDIFSFTDGLLVGLPSPGTVRVLAVEKESRADQAGFKGNDHITKVGTTPVHDLSGFMAAYFEAKNEARGEKKSSFAVFVTTGSGQESALDVPLPPTFSTNFF